jgi:hypothetical protein
MCLQHPRVLLHLLCRYAATYGVRFDPSTQALSLIGSQEGLGHLLMAIADPGGGGPSCCCGWDCGPACQYAVWTVTSYGSTLAGGLGAHVPRCTAEALTCVHSMSDSLQSAVKGACESELLCCDVCTWGCDCTVCCAQALAVGMQVTAS